MYVRHLEEPRREGQLTSSPPHALKPPATSCAHKKSAYLGRSPKLTKHACSSLGKSATGIRSTSFGLNVGWNYVESIRLLEYGRHDEYMKRPAACGPPLTCSLLLYASRTPNAFMSPTTPCCISSPAVCQEGNKNKPPRLDSAEIDESQ